MAVYDCCMFLNENDLYEIRLNSHWDFVDKFIVIEATETHTGLPKQPKFDHERFKPYASKLEYRCLNGFTEEMAKYPHLVDQFILKAYQHTPSPMDWLRDSFQNNYLTHVLAELGAKDTDIVYFSCLDELIRKSTLENCLPAFEDKNYRDPRGLRPIFFLQLYLYAYKINLLHKHWTQHMVGTLTEYSNFKLILPATIRQASISTHPPVPDAGWHFTFLDPTDGELVLEKQRSWAHSKDVYPGMKTKFDHTTKEEAVARLFHDYALQKVEITEDTHPKWIVDNLDSLQNFIYKD
jgi:hypothetical protein